MNKNLKTFNEYTPEERRELGRKGGQNSAKKRREYKKFEEVFKQVLKRNVKTPKGIKKYADEYLKDFPEYEELTIQEAIALSVAKKAVEEGDIESIRFIRDTIGEKPVDMSKIEGDVDLKVQIDVIDE